MSFFGSEDGDWVELDVDLFDRQRLASLQQWLDEARPRLEEWLGTDYDIDIDNHPGSAGHAVLSVAGRRRFRVEIGRDDRIVFTAIPDPEGPL